MFRQCPSCGSLNVRRSAAQGVGVRVPRGLFSRYNCRNCSLRFRVVSKRFYGLAGVIGLALLPPFLAFIIYVAFSP